MNGTRIAYRVTRATGRAVVRPYSQIFKIGGNGPSEAQMIRHQQDVEAAHQRNLVRAHSLGEKTGYAVARIANKRAERKAAKAAKRAA